MLPQAYLLAPLLFPCHNTPCFSEGGNVVSLFMHVHAFEYTTLLATPV